MKIITIVGARPQFIKAATLSRELAKYPGTEEIIVHTGQHFDDGMSEVFFREMEIPRPKYNLEINSLGHGAMTGRMLEGIEKILLDEKPDFVLVYGDTNSTLAGALAAKKLHIPVGHVEAGLRSFNMNMPEEINRILTDRVSDYLFCPTVAAVKNLENEGFKGFDCRIERTGDIMQDAAYYYAGKSAERSSVLNTLNSDDFVLCTLHRAENTDDPVRLKHLVDALNEIHNQCEVVVPLHPRTQKQIKANNLHLKVRTLPPVGYFDMIELLKHCRFVMTDSGGLQKEAFFFKKLCITLRDQTEWVELVEHNFNVVVGANKHLILEEAAKINSRKPDFSIDLYGGGKAAGKICKTLQSLC